MNLLPIHAAISPPQEAGMAVPPAVEIAYVPSARALRRARNIASQLADRPPAFVGVGDPTGSLLFAPLELVDAAKRFNDPNGQLFTHESVNKAAVLAAIRRGATHVHFCCHGVFEPWDPAGSGFILDEHARIRLDDLDRLPHEAFARLLVASSCQTAITDFQRLPDEALGLPSALLEAGVGAVLAALWPVEDVAGARPHVEFLFQHRRRWRRTVTDAPRRGTSGCSGLVGERHDRGREGVPQRVFGACCIERVG